MTKINNLHTYSYRGLASAAHSTYHYAMGYSISLSQVSSTSTGGYVISGGYYQTASGAPTTVNGTSGNFAAYYVGGDGSENVKKRHASAFDNAGGGKVNTFGVSFAFGGGYQFEIGVVRDSKGASRTFVSHGPVVGFNLSVGFNEKAIRPALGQQFAVKNYQGYASGYSLGFFFGGFESSGNRNNIKHTKEDLWTRGDNYDQLGFGVFQGVDFGISWSRTHTRFID